MQVLPVDNYNYKLTKLLYNKEMKRETPYKDRHNKQIFEGDVLTLVTQSRFKGEQRCYHPRVVEYLKGEFVFAKKHNGFTYAYHKVQANKKGKIKDLEIAYE